jgi:putative oxidoreductase
MKTGAMDWIALLGRVLMSAIFLHAGYAKAIAPAATMAMFRHLDLPLPGAVYALALVIEIGGGALFLIGYRARLIGLALAVWSIVTAMSAHYHPADAAQMIHFWKNVCMAGGFLQVVAFGAGRLSADRGKAPGG